MSFTKLPHYMVSCSLLSNSNISLVGQSLVHKVCVQLDLCPLICDETYFQVDMSQIRSVKLALSRRHVTYRDFTPFTKPGVGIAPWQRDTSTLRAVSLTLPPQIKIKTSKVSLLSYISILMINSLNFWVQFKVVMIAYVPIPFPVALLSKLTPLGWSFHPEGSFPTFPWQGSWDWMYYGFLPGSGSSFPSSILEDH